MAVGPALILLAISTTQVQVAPSGVKIGTWVQSTPIEIEIVRSDRSATWVRAAYQSVKDGRAQGVINTPGGSSLLVTDQYQNVASGFVIDRTVRVLTVGTDKAFASRFSLVHSTPSRIRDNEFFVPGVWYKRNESVPKNALAADPDAEVVLIREDRLPLPIALVRNPQNGNTLELSHLNPDGSAFAGEDHRPRIVDGRMQFGSIGFLNSGKLAIAFQFPGSEGDRTYIGGPGNAWALRSHPMELGFKHQYRLRVTTDSATNFATAVQAAWRRAFEEVAPKVPKANQAVAYRESLNLLARVGVRYNGVPSMPFQVRVPTGEVIDTSSQMGFEARRSQRRHSF